MRSHLVDVATHVIIMAILISVMLLIAGIGILILIHFCIVGRAFRRGFGGNTNPVENSSFRSASMSRDDLEKLPCFDFQAREKGSSPVDCAVCLDNLKAGDKCRLLPQCRHSFHAECVDLWLLKTPICPICRTSADFLRGGSFSGGESSRLSRSGSGHLTSTQFAEDHLAENDQFNTTSIDERVSQTHAGNNYSAEIVIQDRQVAENNGSIGERGIESRAGQAVESRTPNNSS